MSFTYPFHYRITGHENLSGELVLSDTRIMDTSSIPVTNTKLYRTGKIELTNGRKIDIILGHSPAISEFIYLRQTYLNPQLLQLVGLNSGEFTSLEKVVFPGQLTLGIERTCLVGSGVKDLLDTPDVKNTLRGYSQEQVVTVPVLREGSKYQIAEALFHNYDLYCDEIVAYAYHVMDKTVPSLNRRVELSIFKDQDITEKQRKDVELVFIGDSIASGTVLLGMMEKIQERFENVKRVEIVAPFAALLGLTRLAAYSNSDISIRAHIFETVLNALPPDYFYSAHYSIPELHIRPELEEDYQLWWGKDNKGNIIAHTACAGYGWSEAIFSPRKHIQMMNQELQMRHQLTIADIVRRNLEIQY